MYSQEIRPFNWDWLDAETNDIRWGYGPACTAQHLQARYLDELENNPWGAEVEKAYPVSGDYTARTKRGRIRDSELYPRLGQPVPKFFG